MGRGAVCGNELQHGLQCKSADKDTLWVLRKRASLCGLLLSARTTLQSHPGT